MSTDEKTQKELAFSNEGWWLVRFDQRQLDLIKNCRQYANNDPAGLPGHNLMIIINELVEILTDI